MTKWQRAALLAGIGYSFAGIVFAIPRTHSQFWRLASWAMSGVVLSWHIAYERFRLKNPPLTAAWHAAVGAAIGGFGLAAGANINSMIVARPSPNLRMLRLSLAIWPVVLAIPSFLVALVLSVILARKRD